MLGGVTMELPIPRHLKNFLHLIGDNNEYSVSGTIRCKCGSKSFYIYESNNKKIVKVTCSECGKDILLFDEGKHGWNGFVCKDDFLDRNKPFILTECDKCNNSKFNIKITIESQGKEDFIEECGINDDINSDFKESDWVDAFEWINISITCLNCRKEQLEWCQCETM